VLFWLNLREARAVHEVVREKWADELAARRSAEKRDDQEAAMRARRRSETFGRLMQRIERRLTRKGVDL
jgi:hypothetical protein